MRIALAGNPNSGKTTMFNALTGRNEKVGNWAGVTVLKKEAFLKRAYSRSAEKTTVVDLPGAYSMSPFTSEESVTSAYVTNEKPDVILNIVDATNLGRSLFFTTQLLELGIPVVVALNKTDVSEKQDMVIRSDDLAALLGCPVVNTVSTSAKGLRAAVSAAMAQVGQVQRAPYVSQGTDLTDKAAVAADDRRRFSFVNGIVEQVEVRKEASGRTIHDTVDAVLTHKWVGIPLFAVVMFLVFQISQVWVGQPLADALVAGLERFQALVASWFVNASPLLTALLVDGIVGGLIAVVGFLPLVMVMYFLLALLEDCGYMTRVSVVLDPLFKRVGLSGKSVIPFVMAVGCAVPGVMASRTIRDERERRATAMLAPFMPCGAKIPVIALIAGAFFGNAGWVSAAMYLAGIVLIFLGALLVNCLTGHRAKTSFFILELPSYKVPSLWQAVKSMCSRGWAYLAKAATIILLCNTAVQVLQSFDWRLQVAQTADQSMLASVAGVFAYLLTPVVGIVSWQLAAAAITGFIAKENVVGTLAVCFAGVMTAESMGLTQAAALGFLAFNLFSPPCFAAIGAMASEMKSAKWLWGGIALQLGMGFSVGFLVYQIGTLVTVGVVGSAFWAGVIAVAAMAAIVCALCVRAKRQAR